MPSTRDMLRRVLGWFNSKVLEPIDTSVGEAFVFESRPRGSEHKSTDRQTLFESRARGSEFTAARRH